MNTILSEDAVILLKNHHARWMLVRDQAQEAMASISKKLTASDEARMLASEGIVTVIRHTGPGLITCCHYYKNGCECRSECFET